MKIKKQRRRIENVHYRLTVYRKGEQGGMSVDCDEHGNVFPFKNECVKKNFEEHIANAEGKYDKPFVQTFRNAYYEPAVGECNRCGHDVHLHGFTNTCEKCGTDYNMSGQQLASREQWGEETGESLSDILNPRYDEESGLNDY